MPASERGFEIGKPYPHRHQVSAAFLWFAVTGSAAAWALQHTSIYVVASHACSPAGQPGHRLIEGWEWAWSANLGLSIACLILALASLAASLLILRRTGGHRRGADADLLRAGGGRTRYLATWGIWSGVLFLLVIVSNLLIILWMPTCPG